jgi:O-antigen ligase
LHPQSSDAGLVNTVLLTLVTLAIVTTQIFGGGKEFAYCLPGYFLLGLAAVLSWWSARHVEIRRQTLQGLAGCALLLGYVSFRALFSPEEYLARKDLYLALAAATLYFLVALNLTSSKFRLFLVATLLLLGFANCAIGAIQFFRGENFMPFDFLPRSSYGFRASGFYGYPNHLAGFLEVTLLMGLSVALWSRWPRWARILAGYVSLVCLLGLLATGSRGGYISGTVGLLTFGLLSLRLVGRLSSERVIGLIVAGGLMTLLVVWGIQQLVARSYDLHARASETLTVDPARINLWRAAWRQLELKPLTGTGSRTYLYYGRQFRAAAIQTDPVHAHNDFIQFLAEYGILGFAVVGVFLETHLRNGWRSSAIRMSRTSFEAGSNSLALTVGALSATAACLVQSFLDFNLHSPANMLVMAFVFGLLADSGTADDSTSSVDDPTATGLSPYARLALPALGLGAMVRLLPMLPAEYYAERARISISDWRFIMSPEPERVAAAFAQRGLEWDAHNPLLHFYLGYARASQAALSPDLTAKAELYSQSVSAYAKAVAFAPQDVGFILSLASSLDALQQFADSEPLYSRAVELDPHSGAVRYAYAAHLHTVGKLEEAAAQYQQSIKLFGGEPAEMGLKRVIEELKAKRSHETGALEKQG